MPYADVSELKSVPAADVSELTSDASDRIWLEDWAQTRAKGATKKADASEKRIFVGRRGEDWPFKSGEGKSLGEGLMEGW